MIGVVIPHYFTFVLFNLQIKQKLYSKFSLLALWFLGFV